MKNLYLFFGSYFLVATVINLVDNVGCNKNIVFFIEKPEMNIIVIHLILFAEPKKHVALRAI